MSFRESGDDVLHFTQNQLLYCISLSTKEKIVLKRPEKDEKGKKRGRWSHINQRAELSCEQTSAGWVLLTHIKPWMGHFGRYAVDKHMWQPSWFQHQPESQGAGHVF